jgi:carbohydrate kinase (thermoresistant glucokinase family)
LPPNRNAQLSPIVTIIIMGVSGCGKSTVGKLLAPRLGATFLDADDFHPPANVEKMRNGQPLTDDDRAGWLDRLCALIADNADSKQSIVLACSALKESYRLRLSDSADDVSFVHLKGTFETIMSRLEKRGGHYMPASLLESQFAALEEPHDAITIDIGLSPNEAVENILIRLREATE